MSDNSLTNLTNMEEKTFLAICSFCKRIKPNRKIDLWLGKDDDVDFKLYDLYMGNKDRTILSHGLCSECLKEHYPEYV